MTFEQLQDAVMDRLNLTSVEARTRIKAALNLRYREVQSTLNLARTRRGLVTVSTVSGQATVTQSGVAKILGLYDGDVRHAVLEEIALPTLFQLSAVDDTVGTPVRYAIDQHLADVVVLRFYPRPNAAIALDGDALLAGTDMADDDDEPTIPVDFHDILMQGVLADEYMKVEKTRPAGLACEAKFEKRLGELRYFLVKSSYLTTRQQDIGAISVGRRAWPYPNMAP